jgi:hypothetical protein
MQFSNFYVWQKRSLAARERFDILTMDLSEG